LSAKESGEGSGKDNGEGKGKGKGKGKGEEDEVDKVDKGDGGQETRPLAVGGSRDTKSESAILMFRDSGEEGRLLIPGDSVRQETQSDSAVQIMNKELRYRCDL